MLHITPLTFKAGMKRFIDKPAVKMMLPVSKADFKQFFRDWLVILALVSLFGYGSAWRWGGLHAWPREFVTLLPLYAALIALKFTFSKRWFVGSIKAQRHKPFYAKPLPTNKKR